MCIRDRSVCACGVPRACAHRSAGLGEASTREEGRRGLGDMRGAWEETVGWGWRRPVHVAARVRS
eukprot:12116632-Alexandrium_andersonii.AAC.1